MTAIVTKGGAVEVNLAAHKFDVAQLELNAQFAGLTENLKSRFRNCYRAANPRVERNLVHGDADSVNCGTHQFRCGADFLFAGVLESIYLRKRPVEPVGDIEPARTARWVSGLLRWQPAVGQH